MGARASRADFRGRKRCTRRSYIELARPERRPAERRRRSATRFVESRLGADTSRVFIIMWADGHENPQSEGPADFRPASTSVLSRCVAARTWVLRCSRADARRLPIHWAARMFSTPTKLKMSRICRCRSLASQPTMMRMSRDVSLRNTCCLLHRRRAGRGVAE